MKKSLILIIILIMLIFLPFKTGAWWDNTHILITKYAVLNSKLKKSDFLKKLNFEMGIESIVKTKNFYKYPTPQKTLLSWMKEGAVYEDATKTVYFAWWTIPYNRRYDNHFHNPLKPWYDAGLDDYVDIPGPIHYHATGDSSILWAQNKEKR